jgi:xanthine dehydrogenase FAD-binding subunit
MDLDTVVRARRPHGEAELDLLPGERYMSGGTWLLSEPQPAVTGLVDLTAMGWRPWHADETGLTLSSTCTIARVAAIPDRFGWRAHPLLRQSCMALYGSFKVWNVATVGGNICAALPPGPMTALAVALDGVATIRRPGGARRTTPVERLVTGLLRTTLAPGEMLEQVHLPADALGARCGYRKIAQAEIGRSGAVLMARQHDDGRFVLAITASTLHPEVLRWAAPPAPADLQAAIDGIDSWYSDPHGAADWREHVTRVLAEELRAELASGGGLGASVGAAGPGARGRTDAGGMGLEPGSAGSATPTGMTDEEA